MECLRVQCEALTQFLPKSHLGGSADHGRLYCDPPDEEFLLGPQDPKVAKSDRSLERRKKANKTLVRQMFDQNIQYSHICFGLHIKIN